MPTYRNDSMITHKIKRVDGNSIPVRPGETIETLEILSISDVTITSATPYWNRVVDRDTITLSGTEQDLALSSLTDWVLVLQITDTVTVFCQDSANTPPEYRVHTDSDPVIQIPVKNRFDNLVLTGSGTCEVIQYRDF